MASIDTPVPPASRIARIRQSLSPAEWRRVAGMLAFILALGFAPARPARVSYASFLRPPLRGPPARA